MGHAIHHDLLHHFNSLTKDLDLTHLYQISVDGPNVNMKFFEEFSRHHKERSFHSLINIGSCALHIVYGSFSRGEIKSVWSLKKKNWKVFIKFFTIHQHAEKITKVLMVPIHTLQVFAQQDNLVCFFDEVLVTCI